MLSETDAQVLPQIPGYDVLHHLGAGSTGDVWAVRRPDGVRLAAKIAPAGSEQLDVEASLLTAIEHEHVVGVHEVVELDGQRTALVMDLAEGGSLADALSDRGHLSDGEIVTVLSPIARALHDLHGMGLVHADLSPGNILLTGAGKPLIADFGVSRLAGHVGDDLWATELWAAPEVLMGETPTPASDSYSLGAIAWACLTGEPPAPAAIRPDLADLAPWSSHQTRDLVLSCLSHTPQARPRAGEFATMLWSCARAEPAPVKGSSGRRLGGEPQEALTRRVEPTPSPAAFLEDLDDVADAEPRDGWTRWLRHRSLPILLTGLGAVLAATAVWMLPLGHAARLTLAGTYDARAAVRPSPLPSRPSAAVAGASTSGPPSISSSTSSSAAAPASAATSPAALDDPARVLTGLLAARAAAWRAGTASTLTAYTVDGSPARRKEADALAAMTRQHLRLDQLAFSVRSTTVRPGDGERHIVAVVDQSAYQLAVSGKATQKRPAQPGQRIDFAVRWTAAGWRLVGWSPAGT